MDIKPIIYSVNLKGYVIIDCGHLSIFSQDSGYSLGGLESPALKK